MATALCAMAASCLGVEPFQDVTDAVGLKGLSGSVAAWVDFDNDGWVDLHTGGQLWRNQKGKQFARVKNVALPGPGVWGDFDNDGYADVFILSAAGRLYRNRRGKGFDPVTPLPKLPMGVCLGAVWGDFDGDGLLDLYIGGYEIWQKAVYPDVIWRNRDEGKFEEIWRTPGRAQPARGITTADFDADGDLDVYVSNYRLAPNLLWRNNGKGRFTNVAAATGTAGDGALGAWGHTIGSAWGDFDNDGRLDLFVGNFSHRPGYQDRSKFLRNPGPTGKFRFEDKSAQAGLHWQESYASPALADFDNDGRLDLFFSTVYPRDRSVLYRNKGRWRFENVSAAAKVDRARTYQAAWGDYDHDGYLDLATGGRLLRNPGGKGHWLKMRLRRPGKASRPAIGAQARLTLGKQVLTRQVETGTGQGNQNESILHFGLGAHTEMVTVVILWPGGGKTTHRLQIDRTVEITAVPMRGTSGTP